MDTDVRNDDADWSRYALPTLFFVAALLVAGLLIIVVLALGL